MLSTSPWDASVVLFSVAVVAQLQNRRSEQSAVARRTRMFTFH